MEYFFSTIIEKLTGDSAWLYFAIPISTGIMGWITNIVALKMTFRPIEFIGIPPYLGWQGVVPRKAVKIARQFSQLLTDNLISMEDIFERIDPGKVSREMEPAIDNLIEPTMKETVREESPSTWELLPDWSKREVYEWTVANFPVWVENLVEEDVSIDRISGGDLVQILKEDVERPVEDFIDQVLHERSPSLWESIPDKAQNRILRQIKSDLPEILSRVINEWQENIEDIFDLEEMTVEEIKENREILNEVFQKSGRDELTFIRRSGLYFGTLFGLFQMFLWMFYDHWLLLPIVGFFVGVTTNYIAINLIFSPKQPYKLGPFSIQGLAYKRRGEINRIFSRITINRVFNVENIFDNIFHGSNRERLYQILQRHTHSAMDKIGGPFNSLIDYVIGTERYFELKNRVTRELMNVLPEAVEYSYNYLEDELQLEKLLRENLEELSPEEYENIMRTPYKEDEWILISVGGALGFTVGLLQLVYLFGGKIPFL